MYLDLILIALHRENKVRGGKGKNAECDSRVEKEGNDPGFPSRCKRYKKPCPRTTAGYRELTKGKEQNFRRQTRRGLRVLPSAGLFATRMASLKCCRFKCDSPQLPSSSRLLPHPPFPCSSFHSAFGRFVTIPWLHFATTMTAETVATDPSFPQTLFPADTVKRTRASLPTFKAGKRMRFSAAPPGETSIERARRGGCKHRDRTMTNIGPALSSANEVVYL